MSPELLSLIGGGVSGFIFKLIATQQESLERTAARAINMQKAADASADAAAKRSAGVWVRRGIVLMVLFGLIIGPYINAHMHVQNVVETPQATGLIGFVKGILGFGKASWKAIDGFIILPEVRSSLLAIVGFYFGSSQFRN